MSNFNIGTLPLHTQSKLSRHFFVAVETVKIVPRSVVVDNLAQVSLVNASFDRLDEAIPPTSISQRETLSLNILVRKILQLVRNRGREIIKQLEERWIAILRWREVLRNSDRGGSVYEGHDDRS